MAIHGLIKIIRSKASGKGKGTRVVSSKDTFHSCSQVMSPRLHMGTTVPLLSIHLVKLIKTIILYNHITTTDAFQNSYSSFGKSKAIIKFSGLTNDGFILFVSKCTFSRIPFTSLWIALTSPNLPLR